MCIIITNFFNNIFNSFIMKSELCDALQCTICMDVSTLPVHVLCNCDMRSRPTCLKCMRNYLKLNEKAAQEKNVFKIKSPSGCKCFIQTQYYDKFKQCYQKVSSYKLYKHTKELWSIRDILSLSECPNNCQKMCISAELHRHIQNDCPNSIIHCNIDNCSFIGPRHIVECNHKEECHANKYAYCHVCDNNVLHKNYVHHIHEHVMRFKMCVLESKIHNINAENDILDKKIIQEYGNKILQYKICPGCNPINFNKVFNNFNT